MIGRILDKTAHLPVDPVSGETNLWYLINKNKKAMKRTAIRCYDENASVEIFGRNGKFSISIEEHEPGGDFLEVSLNPEEAEEMAYYILRRSSEMKEKETTQPQ